MLNKDFKLRMQDIKEHFRLINDSFVPLTSYDEDSYMIALVQELECLAADLRFELCGDAS